jgi:hypothetical protein
VYILHTVKFKPYQAYSVDQPLVSFKYRISGRNLFERKAIVEYMVPSFRSDRQKKMLWISGFKYVDMVGRGTCIHSVRAGNINFIS